MLTNTIYDYISSIKSLTSIYAMQSIENVKCMYKTK